MTPVNAPAWLIERPIAHRGLHDALKGIIENTLAAAEAAIKNGFAIECDVQLSSDGEAFVFHDGTLDRLTNSSGAISAKTSAEIVKIHIKGSDRPPATFDEFLKWSPAGPRSSASSKAASMATGASATGSPRSPPPMMVRSR